jgi:SAM-dependent methyltransferase
VRRIQELLIRHARRNPDPAIDRYLHALVAGVSGSVVEIGCGVGNLFPYYPENVAHLLAVEPDPTYRAAAIEMAKTVRIAIEVSPGLLPLESNSADFVVSCNTFCSLADPAAMALEIGRVLRPGGELRLLEHVAARSAIVRAGQMAVDALGWPRLLNGCHASRRTREVVESAGFEFVAFQRFTYLRMVLLAPLAPHMIGTARQIADE